MNIILRYRGLDARAAWSGLVEASLRKLQNRAAVGSAEVTLERHREIKPSFRVHAWLEVPGPDFHAEARDYTLQAAFFKVVKNLERQIRARQNRRADKRKTNLQLGRGPGRPAVGLAATGA